jgi:copper(I)-binding protein
MLAACGSDDDGQGVSIENAWARTSAAGQTTGAIYFDLTVDEDDTLSGASVPASVAADAQIHEVVMSDMSGDDVGDMGSDTTDMGGMGSDTTDMGGMGSDTTDMGDMGSDMGEMTMQELVDGLALSAGQTVKFEPGSYHVMLIDLVEPLGVGDEIDLTLEFETAGSVEVTVEVAESAP